MPTPQQTQAAHERLQARDATLRVEVQALDDERSPAMAEDPADPAETGEQRTRDAVRSAEQDRDSAELRDIAAALARIEQGRYGVCVDCGNDIPWARLEVQPTAARCIACQTTWEQAHPVEVRATLPGPQPGQASR